MKFKDKFARKEYFQLVSTRLITLEPHLLELTSTL